MSYQKQIIGNGGHPARPSRPGSSPRQTVHTRSYAPSTSSYPSYGDYPGLGGGEPFTPAPPQNQGSSSGGGLASLFGSGGSGSSFNMAKLQQVVDRMGGIDGIIETITKMQKVAASVQQFAPLIRLLFKKNSSQGDDYIPPRRRRRRRRRSGKRRRR